MLSKSSAAVVSSKRASKEIKVLGLDTPASLLGREYVVNSVDRIRFDMCLHGESQRFVVSDDHLSAFITATRISDSGLSFAKALLNYFGEAALFSTPDYFFCLETLEDSILCVDNDSGKSDKTLVIQELQCVTHGDHSTWFVTPIVAYARIKDGTLVVDVAWRRELGEETRRSVESAGVSMVENAQFNAQRVLAFLALLNTKGASERKTVAPDSKLLAANKKRGKSTFNPFTYVLFSGSYGEGAPVGSTGCKAAHVVRGHFKRRKTGVFWWKPHIAGSGELKQREAYIVKP